MNSEFNLYHFPGVDQNRFVLIRPVFAARLVSLHIELIVSFQICCSLISAQVEVIDQAFIQALGLSGGDWPEASGLIDRKTASLGHYTHQNRIFPVGDHQRLLPWLGAFVRLYFEIVKISDSGLGC